MIKQKTENQVNQIFGYCRVSTEGQNLESQIQLLQKAGVHKENIFQEKLSGTTLNRPVFNNLLLRLRKGDQLIVTELSRLSRRAKDLLNLLENFEQKGITFKSLKEDWFDTSTSTGKLMIRGFAAFVEYERDLISERTKIGLNIARAQGKLTGRKSLSEKIIKDLLIRYDSKQYSVRALCAELRICPTTLYKYVRIRKEKEKEKQIQQEK